MLQSDDETLGSTAETLVIQFDQERFEQVLSGGGKSPSNVHKHRKVSVVRSPLTTVEKQVFDKTKKAICRPISALCKAKQTSLKSVLVSTETRTTSRQCLRTTCEVKIAPKAIWIAKSSSASCKAKNSLISR